MTDQRERERELRRYETIVETVEAPVYALDGEGRFAFVNRAFVRKTGYDEDELIGAPSRSSGPAPSPRYDDDELIGAHVEGVLDSENIERDEGVIRPLRAANADSATFEVDLVGDDDERIPCENHVVSLVSEERALQPRQRR